MADRDSEILVEGSAGEVDIEGVRWRYSMSGGSLELIPGIPPKMVKAGEFQFPVYTVHYTEGHRPPVEAIREMARHLLDSDVPSGL